MALSRKKSGGFPPWPVGSMEQCCLMQALPEAPQVVCHTKGAAQVMGQAWERGLVCSTTQGICTPILFPRPHRRTRDGLPLRQVYGFSGMLLRSIFKRVLQLFLFTEKKCSPGGWR